MQAQVHSVLHQFAHDVRNAISPLSCAVEIMGNKADEATMARALPMARSQIKEISRLVNNLLIANPEVFTS